ncbi:MAG: transglycosylase domain-containing protein [Rikenellaceae bacterium]
MDKNKKWSKENKWVAILWGLAAAPFVSLFILLTLITAGAFGRLPSFEELENPKSNLATEVFSEDGKVIGAFFIENRSYLQFDELFPHDPEDHLTIKGRTMPPLVAALVATEDERFYSHGGIDIPSLMRVIVKTVAMQNTSQGGGSTITQQLAKNLFPRDTTRYNSKVARNTNLALMKFKEWITAVKLEYNYTKEEIVAMYLNTVGYGSNAHSIKAAAQTFFDKEPHELSIEEAAVLVGVVNAPTRYSPVSNPANSITRRNVVLARMAKAGAISQVQYDTLSAKPIELRYNPISNNYGEAQYFREMLRLTMNAKPPTRNQFTHKWDYEQALKQYNENPIYGWCLKNTKADGTPYNIYRDGLKIYTTINSSMQRYAEEAVQKQLEEVIQPMMDAQARALRTIFVDATKEQEQTIMRNAIRYSDRYFHMTNAGHTNEEIMKSFNEKCKMRVFTFKGIRDTIMTPRDSILHHKRIMRASFVAIDPSTGGVRAYVGGPNFRYFKYDMAKQGKRQMGSTIKPLVYTFAIDHLGLTPCTPVQNLPVTIDTPGGVPWSPKEAGTATYNGYAYPLKWGLARSRNNYSAWIMKEAKQPRAVSDFIHNVGVKSYIDPVPSLCLGTSESNVFEMASAYSTFVNRGVHTDPIFVTRIEDKSGNVIANFVPKSQDAISERTAYTMLNMLEEVVKGGTAIRLVWNYEMGDTQIGGKTGTSQKNRDAWFVSVAPKIVTAAWVGGEDQVVHLKSRGEGSVLALPIVGDFMTRVYEDSKLGITRRDRFMRPAGMPTYVCDPINPPEMGANNTPIEDVDEGPLGESAVQVDLLDDAMTQGNNTVKQIRARQQDDDSKKNRRSSKKGSSSDETTTSTQTEVVNPNNSFSFFD